MSAIPNWKIEYEAFQKYTSAHDEIRISENEFSIPHDIRDEFYEQFDAIRRAVVEDYYASLPVDVGTLCNKYLEVEREVIELLRLDGVSMPIDLSSFLHGPKDGLTRMLYNKLSDLMQGKMTMDDFERQAKNDLSAGAVELYHFGYEPWVALAVIRFLEPDEAFLVDIDYDDKIFLKELKDISFGRQAHHNSLRLPEFIIHSSKLKKYVAVKMAAVREIEAYKPAVEPVMRPKNRTGDTSHTLASRVMLLYVMENKDKIPVVADLTTRKMASPHLMIECIAESELCDPDVLWEVNRRCNIMQPIIGTYLVVRDPSGEAALEKLADTVSPIAAGLDRSKLQLIIDQLAEKTA